MSSLEAAVAPVEAGHDSKKLGMWVFIGSEAILFGNLIAAYLYLRVKAGEWRQPECRSWNCSSPP